MRQNKQNFFFVYFHLLLLANQSAPYTELIQYAKYLMLLPNSLE